MHKISLKRKILSVIMGIVTALIYPISVSADGSINSAAYLGTYTCTMESRSEVFVAPSGI